MWIATVAWEVYALALILALVWIVAATSMDARLKVLSGVLLAGASSLLFDSAFAM